MCLSGLLVFTPLIFSLVYFSCSFLSPSHPISPFISVSLHPKQQQQHMNEGARPVLDRGLAVGVPQLPSRRLRHPHHQNHSVRNDDQDRLLFLITWPCCLLTRLPTTHFLLMFFRLFHLHLFSLSILELATPSFFIPRSTICCKKLYANMLL